MYADSSLFLLTTSLIASKITSLEYGIFRLYDSAEANNLSTWSLSLKMETPCSVFRALIPSNTPVP